MNLIETCGEFLFWIVSLAMFNILVMLMLIVLWVLVNVLYFLVV